MRPMIALALALLPACVQAQSDDACGAAGFQGLIGQTGQIARLLELAQPARVIGPGDMVTMDYRPDRINFEIDDHDRIAVVRCG
ncbi:I78 family peptidase inhibitor [Roseicyclus mahoneyensis]|uniref:Peptidase inhibitor I78 family protein n=1 Tax=Roseicyclus mahoneyensis TaxID=164332 RepID=A0A316GKE4_9RHOB|nr:I78 family peptidase inhibitor [Roseicyclus mahoneyensis]PWK61525.1 peptidase inhibitor I78 family protein [Roseicyclus mahoneyensis]